jgi:hypothetical protein
VFKYCFIFIVLGQNTSKTVSRDWKDQKIWSQILLKLTLTLTKQNPTQHMYFIFFILNDIPQVSLEESNILLP